MTLFGPPSERLEPLLNRAGPMAGFVDLRERVDALIFELVDERRAAHEGRDDVLSILLDARHEDGSPMSDQELRDELMTLLVAGHETTATSLAWAFERLVRAPDVLRRLVAELDSGDDDAYLTATVQETLRSRPVLPNTQPRLVVKPIDVGEWHFEPGVVLVANGYLLHHDPAYYPEPYTFRPERFLDGPPGTYTWIPFGGGRRRCLGALRAARDANRARRGALGLRGRGRRPRAPRWRAGATSRSALPTALGSAPGCASAPPSRPDARARSPSRAERSRSYSSSVATPSAFRDSRASSSRSLPVTAAARGSSAAAAPRSKYSPSAPSGPSGTVRRPPRISASPRSPRAQRTTCIEASVPVALAARSISSACAALTLELPIHAPPAASVATRPRTSSIVSSPSHPAPSRARAPSMRASSPVPAAIISASQSGLPRPGSDPLAIASPPIST